MNYEKRYNELIDAIKEMMEANPHDEGLQNWVHDNVSELTESEDEKMIKFIKNQLFNIKKTITENYELDAKLTKAIAWLEKLKVFAEHGDGLYYFGNNGFTYVGNPTCDNVSWIEKQGEKPQGKTALEAANEEKVDNANIVEPKFKVGDWVVTDKDGIVQIGAVNKGYYTLNNGMDFSASYVEKYWRLWTIEDAKPGDVLYYKSDNNIEYIVMNKGINMHDNIDSYFRYNSLDGFAVDVPAVLSAENDNITLATREQRDLLFSKMKEAGYEWNAEKKEIKKVEDEPKNYKQQVMSEMTDLVKDYIKQKPSWSEEDEKNLQGIIDEIEANKNEAPSYDLSTYDKYLNWLKSLRNKII